MANNCTTNYMIHGAKEDVESLVAKLAGVLETTKSLDEIMGALDVVYDGSATEGIIKSPLEVSDVMKSMSGDYYVEVTVSTPSKPCIKAVEALLKTVAPYCVYFFITWNKNDELFFTNDTAKEFYDYDYFSSCSCDEDGHSAFRDIEGDARFWNEIDFEDAFYTVLNESGIGAQGIIDTLSKINTQWVESGSDDYLYAHLIKRGDTQEIEEDYVKINPEDLIDGLPSEDEDDADGEDSEIPDALVQNFDNLLVKEETQDNPMSYSDNPSAFSTPSSPIEEDADDKVSERVSSVEDAGEDISVPIVHHLRSLNTGHIKTLSSCNNFENEPYTEVATVGKNVDYTSIQQAINSMPEGSLIYIEPGTYIEDIEINKKVTLTGLIEHDTNLGEYPVIVPSGDKGFTVNAECTLRHLIFTGTSLPDLDQVIDIINKEEEYVTVEKKTRETALVTSSAVLKVYSCFFIFSQGSGVSLKNATAQFNDSFFFANGKSAIELNDTNDVSIKRCRIAHNGEDGVYMADSKGVSINDSYMRNQKEDGIAVDDGSETSIYNCVIYYNEGKGINHQGTVSVKASSCKLLANGNDSYAPPVNLENCRLE